MFDINSHLFVHPVNIYLFTVNMPGGQGEKV